MKRAALVLLLVLAGCSSPAIPTRPASPAPLDEVRFPPYETQTLENGLTVFVLEQHEQPIVSIRLLIRAGTQNDPAGLPGVAAMMASLLDKGTATRSATEIAQWVDESGGSLGASADAESTIVHASAFATELGATLDLLADVLLRPAFAPDEIERARQQALSNLAASLEDPAYLADLVMQKLIYGAHPYGSPEGGTPDSVRRIRRDDLQRFHQTYVAPNISAIAVSGDVRAAEVFEAVREALAPWARKEVPRATAATGPDAGGRVVLVDKPDSVQTEIRMGLRTVARKDKDYFSLLFASQILGGPTTGRLHRSLRVQKGLTYGAYATVQPHIEPGAFLAVTQTATEKTGEALDGIYQELEAFRAAAVPAEELADAQSFIIGGFPLSLETPSDLSTRLVNVFLFDLGADYLGTYRNTLAAIRAQDVYQAAQDHLDPKKMSVVLVGNASALTESMKRFDRVEVIPLDRLDVSRPDLRR